MDSKGHIYNYGTDYLGGFPDANQTYTALVYTPSGNGYTLMDRVGHIYNYGDSAYLGGYPAGAQLPMRGLTYKPGTLGYTLLDATGHIYNYGTDYLGGFPQGATPNFVGLVYTPSGNGYAMVDAVGHVYNYGDSIYRGGFDAISSPSPSGTGDLHTTIVQRAQAELSKGVTETPLGSNCNPYSYYWQRGSTNCPSGTRAEAWCADFAAYVWKEANARTNGLNAGAISFYHYGQTHGTFKKSNPQPGDAVVFSTRTDTAKHVGIIVAVHSPTSITMISGNRSNKVASDTFDPTINTLWGPVLGFVSPVSN